MNNSKMPGFTAAASLYEAGEPYRMGIAGPASTAGVIPALRCCSACDWLCDEFGWQNLACRRCYAWCNVRC